MTVYLYDGSFEGMLTCIYEGYYSQDNPEAIYNTYTYEANLFQTGKFIVTDLEKSHKVAFAILQKLSETFFYKVVNAFFSEDYDVATYIYQLLRYGFRNGPEVIVHVSHPTVSAVVDLANAVSRENHLFLGLVRFMKLKGGIYYCRFSPTYNQVALLAEHFSHRLSDQLWVMHDVGRNIAVFYDKKSWYINEFHGMKDDELDDEELLYQSLWKTFHKHIAIEERINPNLQRSFMPKKYWKYLIEVN